ncbi:alcohol dehydrogenase [Streptococcus pneumoniae]|nr:alcohol dehydrogenase [Streptococcus pneumoniae]
MKAYTYVKPGLASFVDVDKPVIRKPTDAIVRIVKTTICGTDLHRLFVNCSGLKSAKLEKGQNSSFLF